MIINVLNDVAAVWCLKPQSNRACSIEASGHTDRRVAHTASRGVGAISARLHTDTVCHLLKCSALQYTCIEDIVSANPTMTVPVTKVA